MAISNDTIFSLLNKSFIVDTQWKRNSIPYYQEGAKDIVIDIQSNKVTYFHKKDHLKDKQGLEKQSEILKTVTSDHTRWMVVGILVLFFPPGTSNISKRFSYFTIQSLRKQINIIS